MPRTLIPATALRKRLSSWAGEMGIATDKDDYVLTLADNFFQPLSACTLAEIGAGDGQELGKEGERGKMQALHSSSALAANVFDYWRGRDTAILSSALGYSGRFCQIQFEAKFPTGLGGKAPNLDLLLSKANGGQVAIESKFLEPFGASKKPKPFKEKYFPTEGDGLWSRVNLPEAQRLADRLRAEPGLYKYLDAQQLLKHLLGLGQRSVSASLLYLWYDVGGDAGREHAEETAAFLSELTGLRLPVAASTYQAVYGRLVEQGGVEHRAYLDYLGRRYFGES